MAKLTTKTRNALRSSTFALPGRRYPIEDRSHARNALSRVSQNGTPGEKAEVRAAVHRRYPTLGRLDDGGSVPESGPYDLQEGEVVYPQRMAPIVRALAGEPGGPRTRLTPIPNARPGEARMAPIPNYDPRNAPGYTPLLRTSRDVTPEGGPPPQGRLPERGDSQRYGTPEGANAMDTANPAAAPARQRLAMAAMPAPRVRRLYDNPQPDPPDMTKMAPVSARGGLGNFGGSLSYSEPVRPSDAGGDSAPLTMAPIPTPAQDRLRQDLQQGFQAPKMSTRARVLRTIAATAGGALAGWGGHPQEGMAIGQQVMGAPLNRARQAWDQRIQNETAAANLERQQNEDQRQGGVDALNARNIESEIAERDRRAQPDDPADKKVDEYVDDQGRRVLTFQRPSGEVYDRVGGAVQGKQEGLTSPFEAFAYGSPDERKSAQAFLDLEKRVGARYEKPDEMEERYALFKKDPDTYRQMFGDRGSSQDQAQASRMLNYFDRQKKQIEDDWTLDEQTKAQRLQEIEDMEQPYLSAAAPRGGQPNSAAGNAPGGDRVTVVSPDGRTGTIPRSQLKDAQKKGYKLSQ